MNKYFLIACLFGLVACKSVLSKPDNTEAKPPIKKNAHTIKKSPVPKQPIRKVKKPSFKNIPYIHGGMLYFWKTPQEDQKMEFALNKELPSYFTSLHQELIKRNPENDAKAFLAKKQRFLLGELSKGRTRLRTARGLATNLFRGIDPDAIRKCRRIPPKRLQGDSRVHHTCINSSHNHICSQYISTMKEYRFRWNRVMLKDCEKH